VRRQEVNKADACGTTFVSLLMMQFSIRGETHVRTKEIDNIEARLAAVEKSNRRWRNAGIAFGLGLLLVTSAAADKPDEDRIPDVIYARKFVAVNERNEPVAFMGHENNVGIVSVADTDGSLLFAASATDSGHGVVSTYDRDGRALVSVGANHSGDGHIAVFDAQGKELSRQFESRAVATPVSNRGRPAKP
jgi:hypothetical protein